MKTNVLDKYEDIDGRLRAVEAKLANADVTASRELADIRAGINNLLIDLVAATQRFVIDKFVEDECRLLSQAELAEACAAGLIEPA